MSDPREDPDRVKTPKQLWDLLQGGLKSGFLGGIKAFALSRTYEPGYLHAMGLGYDPTARHPWYGVRAELFESWAHWSGQFPESELTELEGIETLPSVAEKFASCLWHDEIGFCLVPIRHHCFIRKDK